MGVGLAAGILQGGHDEVFQYLDLGRIHDRMPLVVPEADWDRWLDPDAPVDEEIPSRVPDVSGIRMREVSTLVNNVRNNGPELVEPAEPQPEQARLL